MKDSSKVSNVGDWGQGILEIFFFTGFWQAFWPNFASTVLGVLIGIPIALLINRQASKLSDRSRIKLENQQLHDALIIVRRSIKHNRGELNKILNYSSGYSVAKFLETDLDITVWDTVHNTIMEYLRYIHPKRKLNAYYSKLSRLDEINRLMFEYHSGSLSSIPADTLSIMSNLMSYMMKTSNELINESDNLYDDMEHEILELQKIDRSLKSEPD
jgi:hypothetical protein